jgi:uncharacterized protein involved in cysteine biosynthesis
VLSTLRARFRSLRFGATLPWHAARLIVQRRELAIWSLLPIGLTLVLYYFVIGALVDIAQGLLAAWFIDWGLDPGGWLYWAFELMARMVLLLAAAVTFAFTSSIVASPFNDRLGEKAEAYAEPPLSPAGASSWRQQLDLVVIDLGKAVAAGTASLAALLFAWIPVVNLLSFALAFLLVCFQYLSYPQTRRAVGLRDGVEFLWRHRWACTGFGATISLLFALPVVSSLVLPIAVVGGTLLAARCPGGGGLPPLR